MPTKTTKKAGSVAAVGLASAMALSVCLTAPVAAQGRTSSAKSDVTINVAIAYPAPAKNLLAAFTAKTGIKVNYSYIQWDNLQTKIVAAAEAHTYFADVADVDWSKVGEYYQTKWFLPLNKYFNPSALYAQYPQLASFVRNGNLLGMPSDASLLVTTVNTKDFAKAGITTMPTTLAQYTADLNKVKASGVVQHPLDVPFAAAEGLSTYWYELTAAFGGQVLSSSYKPLFTSPNSAGYKAMEWLVSAYKSGLVPKGNLDLIDEQGFTIDQAHNLTASVFSDYSGDVGSVYNVPSSSTVVGDVNYIPTPGAKGPPQPGQPGRHRDPGGSQERERSRDVHQVVRTSRQPGCVRGSRRPLRGDHRLPVAGERCWPQRPREVRQGRRCGRAGHPGRAPLAGHLPGRGAAVVPRLQ